MANEFEKGIVLKRTNGGWRTWFALDISLPWRDETVTWALACTTWVLLVTAALSSAGLAAEGDTPRRSRDDEKATAAAPGPSRLLAPLVTYRSRNFLIRTDLPPDKAEAMLVRLEETLRTVSKYWGTPSRRLIECYVVDDLSKCSDESLPNPLARIFVGVIGGATVRRPDSFGKLTSWRHVVFAAPHSGIAEHEAVHAYCSQTFGRTGPDWYGEGMAQFVCYGRKGDIAVRCPPEIIASIRSGKSRLVREVIRDGEFTQPMIKALVAILRNRAEQLVDGACVPIEDWKPSDAEIMQRAKVSYRWSWALCHMLAHNPNYSDRFRTLGRSYLTERDASFDSAFGSVKDRLDFEYRFFTDRVEDGYRVDLCAWSWDAPFAGLEPGAFASVDVLAARGFQPSGLLVRAGERYTYTTEGEWRMASELSTTNADGDAEGRGSLEGVVMKDIEAGEPLKLGKPFRLGAAGSFTAASGGKLYLRCRDTWHQLDDNDGQIRVRFERPAAEATSQKDAG